MIHVDYVAMNCEMCGEVVGYTGANYIEECICPACYAKVPSRQQLEEMQIAEQKSSVSPDQS